MFFRYAIALALGALVACGAPAAPEERTIRTPSLQRIGQLGFVGSNPSAEPRSMELWVRLGAFDAAPPQHATALAWSFETAELKAAVFPFATRFAWPCTASEDFVTCAKRGLQILKAPPPTYDLTLIHGRLAAGRLAAASSNPDAQAALEDLLDALFEEPTRLRPLGSKADDAALSEAALRSLWDRYYGANNALLVSHGFEPGAQRALEPLALALRNGADRFVQPAFSMQSGEVQSRISAPGYGWTAAASTCFEVLSQLRVAISKLSPTLLSHLIDVRGRGYLAILLGPPPEQEVLDLLDSVVTNASCQSSDPVMRWLIGDPT